MRCTSKTDLLRRERSRLQTLVCEWTFVEIPTVYLDTCIVSGLAKGDLAPDEAKALQRILEARKRGAVVVVTSQVTKGEISAIPEIHRASHEVLYNLLEDVPTVSTHRTDGGLLLLGVGGGRREDPLFTSLMSALPDPTDAEHVFQAAKNNLLYLITTDARTLIRHAVTVEQLCGVKLVTPVAFEQMLSGARGSTEHDG